MAQNYELPAYLQGRKRTHKLSEIATAGIGGGLPAHVSIQGNQFTLIDAAGNEQADEGSTMQAVVADMSSVMCKMYYGGKEYTPGSNEPPVCWSTNGLAPSRDAANPQNADCATCPHNERGSAVSKISGASIKACRDEKHLAIYLPKHPKMLFRLVITPGSFKNWSAFSKPFEGQNVDINDVLVEFGFQPKTNGVLTFRAVNYVDEATAAFCDQAVAEKITDALVGRNDVPWSGYQRALGAPQRTVALPHVDDPGLQGMQRDMATQMARQPTGQSAQLQGASPVPSGTGSAFTPQPTGPRHAEAQPPTEYTAGEGPLHSVRPEQPQRRHRRTKAEIEAAKAQEAGNGPTPPQPAPFRPAPPPSFGIGPGSAPNQEVKGMLDGIFKK